MSRQTPHNAACQSPQHTQEHLCYLMYEGFHLNHKSKYKAMVQDARYRCQQCGRTARNVENLCDPVLL